MDGSKCCQTTTARRRSQNGMKTAVHCLKVVQTYNKYMGGFDQMEGTLYQVVAPDFLLLAGYGRCQQFCVMEAESTGKEKYTFVHVHLHREINWSSFVTTTQIVNWSPFPTRDIINPIIYFTGTSELLFCK